MIFARTGLAVGSVVHGEADGDWQDRITARASQTNSWSRPAWSVATWTGHCFSSKTSPGDH